MSMINTARASYNRPFSHGNGTTGKAKHKPQPVLNSHQRAILDDLSDTIKRMQTATTHAALTIRVERYQQLITDFRRTVL